MAFKLPFLSKGKENPEIDGAEVAARSFGNADSVEVEDANNVKMLNPEVPASTDASLAVQNDNLDHKADATFIGDALEKGGDIRLPVIGKMSLQQQMRVLSITMAGHF